MYQPHGFIDQNYPSLVCRLHKALYGLKQAPRAWYHALWNLLLDFGFVNSHADASLFIFNKNGILVYFLAYVDNMLVTSNNSDFLNTFICELSSQFSTKDLCLLNFFLGIKWFMHLEDYSLVNTITFEIFLNAPTWVMPRKWVPHCQLLALLDSMMAHHKSIPSPIVKYYYLLNTYQLQGPMLLIQSTNHLNSCIILALCIGKWWKDYFAIWKIHYSMDFSFNDKGQSSLTAFANSN